MRNLYALLIGLVFGLGLCVSQMTQPAKVKGFLDLAGAWDPSLAFVMGGAVAVGLVGFGIAKRRGATLLGEQCHLPAATQIDLRLVLGAAIFGVGWGLSGICPGPAVANLASLDSGAATFFAAMVLGMAIERLLLSALAGRNAEIAGED